MKKLAAAFLLGCGILMAGSASAEEKEFGPDFGRFIIDVPDGWNARVIENGVQVVSKDNQSSVMVAIFRVKMPADQVARGTAKAMGDAEVQRQDANHYILKAKDGVETLLSFKGDNRRCGESHLHCQKPQRQVTPSGNKGRYHLHD